MENIKPSRINNNLYLIYNILNQSEDITLRSSLILIILFLCAVAIGLMVEIKTSAEYTILHPDFYLEHMDKHHIYEVPQNYAILKITAASEKPPEFINKAYINAVNTAFSPEWASNQSKSLINNFLAYIKNDNPDLNLELDFSKRKELFTSELINHLNSGEENLSSHGIDPSQKASFADKTVKKLMLPEKIDFAELLLENPQLNKGIEFFRSYYVFSGYLCYILYVLLFVLLLTIGRATGLKTFAISMITAGIFIILVVSCYNNALDRFILTAITGQDSLLATIGTNPVLLATILKNSIINTIEKIGIIFSAAGIILWIIGFYWNKSHKQNVIEQLKSV
jgi:hypothetical protein